MPLATSGTFEPTTFGIYLVRICCLPTELLAGSEVGFEVWGYFGNLRLVLFDITGVNLIIH